MAQTIPLFSEVELEGIFKTYRQDTTESGINYLILKKQIV